MGLHVYTFLQTSLKMCVFGVLHYLSLGVPSFVTIVVMLKTPFILYDQHIIHSAKRIKTACLVHWKRKKSKMYQRLQNGALKDGRDNKKNKLKVSLNLFFGDCLAFSKMCVH
jgi:hypothetical protein